MLKVRDKITHCYQEKAYSCGAAAFAMIFNVSEADARELCHTRSSGTNCHFVEQALRKNDVSAHRVIIDEDYSKMFWLPLLSRRWPLYLSCDFISQGARGRPSHRLHAIVAANEMFYDPSESRECPMDAFEHTFNKKLIIRSMIIIEHELPNWRKYEN